MTNEELTTDDLVDLKSARIVRPRPPTLTSIPSLLSVFQNEWDALALETYTLRQYLTQTRQELSTALYQHDAAVRVIVKLTRERDEARNALSKVSVHGGVVSNGEAMQVDRQELPHALVTKVEATQEKYAVIYCGFRNFMDLLMFPRLSKTRRKRAVPSDWATPDTIQSFASIKKSEPLYPEARSIALNSNGDLALLGGANGRAGVYSISQNKVVHELEVGSGFVTDALWAGDRAVFSTSAGAVKIFERGSEKSSFSGHAGRVTALALHPSGDILASVGVDKSYIFYDLTSSTQVTQIATDSGKDSTIHQYISHSNVSLALSAAGFHPDGHLFAAGGVDGQIKVFDVKFGVNAANFDETGPIKALSFSENGTWLAAVVKGSTNVSIWDLRKSASIKKLETGGQVEDIRWDYTGQFLATAGSSGLTVQQYSKSTKEWSEPLRSAIPAVAIEWGHKAHNLLLVGVDGIITILGSE